MSWLTVASRRIGSVFPWRSTDPKEAGGRAGVEEER